jgi:phospholipid/cholesterol/gamma-HCH transport system ATP-binding protein
VPERISEVLELVELPGIEDKRPGELSGGMKKRVGLARAIVHRPEIVLYDEPTTGLDPISSDTIDQLMMRVNESLKATTIVVTHDMRTARRLGERILYLHNGQIYLDDSAENVFMSEDPVVSRFIKGERDVKEVEFT